MTTPSEIITFWTRAGRKAWFAKDDAFDAAIRERFEAAHHAAARGQLDDWTRNAEGALALLLLLDQFPRNLWRGSAHAYATDGLARRIANDAIANGHDMATALELRMFFYLPFEHSEYLADQDRSVRLGEALQSAGGEKSEWARKHREIIARFGRFPHRNEAMGRESTAEERTFLDGGGFAG